MAMVLQRGEAHRLPLADASVQCVATSPPYFGQRRYGDDGRELGTGSLAAYLDALVAVGAELHRVLADDGVVFLNLADTRAGSGGAGGDWRAGKRGTARRWRPGPTGLPRGDACLVPQRVALAFQAELGFRVRSWITWDKTQCRPEDLVRARRPGESAETILLLTKAGPYRFAADRLAERGNVWHVPPARGGRHLAPWPEALVERMVLAGSEPGEVVLDPFSGSHTTARVADRLGRVGVGVELYLGTAPEFAVG